MTWMRHGLLSVQQGSFQRTTSRAEEFQVKGVRSSNVWESMSKMCVSLGSQGRGNLGVNPKMVGKLPNKPMGLNPTKNDQHLGCEMGVPPFKETPTWWWFENMDVEPKIGGYSPPKSSIEK